MGPPLSAGELLFPLVFSGGGLVPCALCRFVLEYGACGLPACSPLAVRENRENLPSLSKKELEELCRLMIAPRFFDGMNPRVRFAQQSTKKVVRTV